jgi:hypothetical protein
VKRSILLVVGFIGCVCLSGPAQADDLPRLKDVPAYLAASQKQALSQTRQQIADQLERFQTAGNAFNTKAVEAQTDEEYARLQDQQASYINAAEAFNANVDAAIEAEFAGRERRTPILVADAVSTMMALSRTLGWPESKQNRLAMALKKLGGDGDDTATGAQIRQVWADVLLRGEDKGLAHDAGAGDGPDLFGAGAQGQLNDCTIFALANAAGLPYSVVAARAASLIRDGEWSDPSERAHAQQVIERWGLIGQEVVMLAEAFGQAEIVSSADFAATLKEHRPVLIDVVPRNGDTRGGHQLVLTKTFLHGGETWYAMMDSNEEPERRLYISHRELGIVLQENGVAFRSEPGTTPALLRDRAPTEKSAR